MLSEKQKKVLDVLQGYSDGVDVDEVTKQTGLDYIQIINAVYVLNKRGYIIAGSLEGNKKIHPFFKGQTKKLYLCN
ncbi:hypothetical protein [Pseudalkalibacillus decolorationis]|uniref:hypothetical protein n=1 Tax=Pseudalkalibacillus decolorationis TaxID=163879 RepID=UPI002147C1E0|nr:hypothetical protein [Pseudalkalibacillus decolorationis]